MNSLSAEQLVYANRVRDMALKEIPGSILLDAPAGTGKTYTTSVISRSLLGITNMLVIAPTHKACGVLRDSNLDNVITIASLLGWTKVIDDETGEETAEYLNKIPIMPVKEDRRFMYLQNDRHWVIFVDEASMIKKEEFDILTNLHSHCTVVYLGDKCQLNPVMESKSPAFTYNHTYNISLKEIRRISNDSAVHIPKFINEIRNGVISKRMPYYNRNQLPYTGYDDFMNKIITSFKQDPENTIVICGTNSMVRYVNDTIRKTLFGKNCDLYMKGEVLMFSGYRPTEQHTYKSSEYVHIKDIETINIAVKYYSDEQRRIGSCKPRRKHAEQISFYSITDQYGASWKIPCTAEDRSNFQKIVRVRRDWCKVNGQGYIRLKAFQLEWNPNLNHIYSITSHKSQGSGWKNVFVQQHNLRYLRDSYSRALYTAVSRTKLNLVLYDA